MYQWFFVPHYYDLNLFLQGKFCDGFKLTKIKIDVRAKLCSAGIARSYKKRIGPNTLAQFPGEGIFPAT